MERLLTAEFWQDVIARAPWVIPSLLIGGLVGWKWKGANDDGEMRGLRAEVKGVRSELDVAAQRLELANEKSKAADEKYKAVVDRENELGAKVARQETLIAELEKELEKARVTEVAPTRFVERFVQLSTSNREIKNALTNLSTSTTNLGQELTALHELSGPIPESLWFEHLTKREDSGR